jgi:hypothetical protein
LNDFDELAGWGEFVFDSVFQTDSDTKFDKSRNQLGNPEFPEE